MIDTAIVICSRSDSKRIPEKPFQLINGIPLIDHLTSRCLNTGIPVVIAIPHRDYHHYKYLKDKYEDKNFHIITGSSDDPLNHMALPISHFNMKTVIRVCHDKIFIDQNLVRVMLEQYYGNKRRYCYSSSFVDGTAFEIIDAAAVIEASEKFKNVEHISYAVRNVIYSDDIEDVNLTGYVTSDHRLIIDYVDDLKVLELILHSLGNECSLKGAIAFLDQNFWVSKINRTPKITVYTCGYNAEKWINKCMGSVSSQNIFNQCEYILIDDCSDDYTSMLMSKFCSIYKNARWIKNQKNLGLSSSSNIALSQSRGKYMIRMDADDYFFNDHALDDLVTESEKTFSEIVYPDNYFGSFDAVQNGSDNHHVGGALFRTRAANFVKFTDGLMGYEGLDFFVRAKNILKISYLKKPIFFYRQHEKSQSKTNTEQREILREKILEQKHG